MHLAARWFPDLVEVSGLNEIGCVKEYTPEFKEVMKKAPNAWASFKGEKYMPFEESSLKTEFAFAVTAPSNAATYGGGYEALKVFKYKPLASKNNWYYGHNGEHRKLTFWWKKFPDAENVKAPPGGFLVGGYGGSRKLTASGCGFKVGSLPLHKDEYFKFFTLLRLPVCPTNLQARWLKMYQFNRIDEGKLSSYYLNGYDPEKWTWEQEVKDFGGWPNGSHFSFNRSTYGGDGPPTKGF